jgi:hypothetical protein
MADKVTFFRSNPDIKEEDIDLVEDYVSDSSDDE